MPLLLLPSLLFDHILLYSPLSHIIPHPFLPSQSDFPWLIFSVDYKLDHDPGLKGLGPFIKRLYDCREGTDHHLFCSAQQNYITSPTGPVKMERDSSSVKIYRLYLRCTVYINVFMLMHLEDSFAPTEYY